MNNLSGIWFVLIMYAKRLIREILKLIWRFLTKKRYAGNMPKLKKAIMLTFLSINAIAWIVAPSYLLVSIPNEKIIIEAKAQSVGDVVDTLNETATQDTTSGIEERKDEPEISESSAPQAVGKIVDIVHRLESSGGKNNFSKCEAIGKYNEFGYGVYGENYLCFEKGEDRKAVIAWFEKEMKDKTLEQSLCKYNTGQATDSCPYVDRFKFLNS